MGKFDGILICTDLDGTLYTKDDTVSEENRKAIRYFKEEGGLFTFITGRMPYFAQAAIGAVEPNAPFGCINGGGLYDAEKEEYLFRAELPKTVLPLVRLADENFSGVGFQVNAFYKTYFCKDNAVMADFRARCGVENLVCHYEKIDEPWAKVLFGSEDQEELERLEKTLRAHPLGGEFSFVYPEKGLLEILPKGIGKGTAVENLCCALGIERKKTVAIGDYYNDVPMFHAAGVGIAVSNACEAAKEAADYVLSVSNEEDAVKNVIEDIKRGKYI